MINLGIYAVPRTRSSRAPLSYIIMNSTEMLVVAVTYAISHAASYIAPCDIFRYGDGNDAWSTIYLIGIDGLRPNPILPRVIYHLHQDRMYVVRYQ